MLAALICDALKKISLNDDFFHKYNTLFFCSSVGFNFEGRDEKGCLLTTEKKAAVDVDQLKKAGCTF